MPVTCPQRRRFPFHNHFINTHLILKFTTFLHLDPDETRRSIDTRDQIPTPMHWQTTNCTAVFGDKFMSTNVAPSPSSTFCHGVFFSRNQKEILKLLTDFGRVDRMWVILGEEEVHVLDMRYDRCDKHTIYGNSPSQKYPCSMFIMSS